jgi:hypothetical protein
MPTTVRDLMAAARATVPAQAGARPWRWVNAGGSVAGLRIARDDGLPLQIGARSMTINVIALQPLVALVAGILILIIPRLLNFIVAIYLIIIGVTGLWPQLLH